MKKVSYNNSKNCLLLILSIILLLNIFNCLSLRQKTENSFCVYNLNNGLKADLNTLKSQVDYTNSIGRYVYKGNFCGPMKISCNGPANAGIYIRETLCVSKLASDWTPNVEYINTSNPNIGIKLTFQPSPGCFAMPDRLYRLSYILKCDNNKDISFDSINKINN